MRVNLTYATQFVLGISTDNKFSSKWLNNVLSKIGYAVSYDEVIRFKQNVLQYDDADEVAHAYGTSFIQHVGDNTDHDINTIDGKNTHQGLGSIVISWYV